MDSRNLDKAIEIYARLIQGETIAKASRENSALYEDYYGNAEVYEIVGNLLKKLNLSIYEYNEALYITPGEGNRVFGYTNDDMKRILGLRLNKELFLCYFLMYVILLYFYKDSGSYQFREFIKPEKVIEEEFDCEGEGVPAGEIKDIMTAIVAAEPLAKIDYIEAVDGLTLMPKDVLKSGDLVAMAVYIGKTRLIDNFTL